MPERHIRSFHPRRGRITPTAQSALTRLLPVYGVAAHAVPGDPSELFQPPLPVVLEIGSGMGEATLQMAAATPGWGVIAVEVHTPGVGRLLAEVERLRLSNVRVCVGDAVEVLARLSPGCLQGIRVFFPDPWPKVRHHKRRLIQPAFVRMAASRLAPGGTLHLATDVSNYAEHMLSVLQADESFTGADLLPRPEWRPVTKFESRALQAGREVYDLLAIRDV